MDFNRVKCTKCKKKHLLIEECKCGYNFCLNCLPFFNHECIFDWKKQNKDELTKLNPKIIAIKVDNI